MLVAVTGGTGFVGSALVKALLDRGDEVWVITRSKSSVKQRHPQLHAETWNEFIGRPSGFHGLDAIVNLAGESIDQRWTAAAKDRILDSRVQAAGKIGYLVDVMRDKPKVVVNASGISYYGTSRTETFDERSPKRVTDFLSGVVEKWEEAADRIKETRVVKLRVGMVLGRDEGALPRMAAPYRFYAGGRVGSGKQWISWIHIDDIVRLILFCIEHPEISGPVNATAPEPLTMDDFGKAIGRALGKPHWLPVPAFLLKLMFGEMSVLVLEGQRVLPRTALEAGFTFEYPDADKALGSLLR